MANAHRVLLWKASKNETGRHTEATVPAGPQLRGQRMAQPEALLWYLSDRRPPACHKGNGLIHVISQ